MKEKWRNGLPVLLVIVFALTRWPGLMPVNFSAAYALAFCAGVYFPGWLSWWFPLSALVISDIGLNLYYLFALHIDSFKASQLFNYLAYILMIALGKRFTSKTSLLKLITAGMLSSVLFYLITNTASWLFNPFQNPEYTRNFTGWLIALTKGTAGYPETWQFFRNTIISGGLFTGLFAGVLKLAERSEKEAIAEPEETSPATPEDAEEAVP